MTKHKEVRKSWGCEILFVVLVILGILIAVALFYLSLSIDQTTDDGVLHEQEPKILLGPDYVSWGPAVFLENILIYFQSFFGCILPVIFFNLF